LFVDFYAKARSLGALEFDPPQTGTATREENRKQQEKFSSQIRKIRNSSDRHFKQGCRRSFN